MEEVRDQTMNEVRAGDVITAVTTRGQTTEIKSAEQFNKLANALDRSVSITLHACRGERSFFVTVKGGAAPAKG